MNVLEKIFEEISNIYRVVKNDEDLEWNRAVDRCRNIIDSCTNEVPNCAECSRIKWYQKGYEDGKKDNGWIPVSERLPEVPEGTEDVYCPEFNVTIKGASKATTLKYAPDGTWFDDSGEVYNVMAWQPLPEPYRPEEVEE